MSGTWHRHRDECQCKTCLGHASASTCKTCLGHASAHIYES
ncbi:Chaperone DnaJ [Gossypium arboreum]|uniref:Chaperone DnaJ n=1 Tax=Gossypium arboreum TaxID=29729 RepID=A0A0B0P456_GOSAR|nr:Chaperone DnaJ [Gossypium arboreum]